MFLRKLLHLPQFADYTPVEMNEKNGTEVANNQNQKAKYKKGARDLNKYSKNQVKHLTTKLQTQTDLEEKWRLEQAKKDNWIQNNEALEQQTVALNLRLRDHKALTVEYERLKMENKTLTQENNKL